MRSKWLLAAFLAVAAGTSTLVGCGGGTPAANPVGPSAAAPLDVTGLWNEQQGSFAMHLQQSGGAITGTASFTDRNAVFDQYAATGTIAGTIAESVMTLTETYQLTSLPGGAPIADCVEIVTSRWTVLSATRMSGQFSQTNLCQGAVVFTKTGSTTVVRQP